ncbi:ABC transporter substrate-binding protein [Mycolicibacillus parakoreensis]|uniref:ABC transporter substrate-binding protein n=1 Tax=Mycolicibacillus parakoreensis TaxID=1069221 RepID=UPI002AED64ED|nr:ABC transporter substrate-binding protein [Mycolicibacillus parakoreensis]
MDQHWSRRGFFGLTAAGLLTAGVSSACSRAEPDEDGQPVTIEHLFGETAIEAAPTRVVSAGFTGHDDLLALGVVPIALTHWFGDEPFAVWPWAQAQLGDAEPVVLSLEDGIDVERIAELAPDLIVATNAGVDADTYDRLSQIAPTVPQTGPEAFFEPWRQQARTIGRAVLAGQRMQTLIDGIDAQFRGVPERYPQFDGLSVLLLDGTLRGADVLAVPAGWQTDFLTDMGFTVAASIAEFGTAGRAVIPRDRISEVLDAADVLIWTTGNDDEIAALQADPEIAALAARQVFTTGEQAGAIAFASPLSYPLVADQLPPLIADGLR